MLTATKASTRYLCEGKRPLEDLNVHRE